MIILIILLSTIAIYFILLIFYAYNPFKRPLLSESDLSNKEWFFYTYYAAKYLLPTKQSRRDSRYDHNFFINEAIESAPESGSVKSFKKQKNTGSFVISAVGDIMFRKDFSNGISQGLWTDVAEDLFDADFTMGNMEFAVNDANVIEKTIQFSIRSEIADQLLKPQDRYFDFLSTANNHINDSLSEGVRSSINYLEQRQVLHSGAWYGKETKNSFPIVEIGGIKTAVLAYSFSTNGVPLEKEQDYGVNLVRFNAVDDRKYDPEIIHSQIDIAKKRGAEFIIAQLHWGVEFEYYPPKRIIERGQKLMEAGIDIIIGHHPHMLTPAQWYKRPDGSRCLCFYSLGNLTSSTLPFPMQNLSLQVKIAVERNSSSGRPEITGAELKPLFFVRRKKRGSIDHRILPLFKALSNPDEYKLTTGDRIAMIRSRNEYSRYLKQDGGFIYR